MRPRTLNIIYDNFSKDDSMNKEEGGVIINKDESPVCDSEDEKEENLQSQMKKARQKAIREAVEKDMTEKERIKERKAADEMLAKYVITHRVL